MPGWPLRCAASDHDIGELRRARGIDGFDHVIERNIHTGCDDPVPVHRVVLSYFQERHGDVGDPGDLDVFVVFNLDPDSVFGQYHCRDQDLVLIVVSSYVGHIRFDGGQR